MSASASAARAATVTDLQLAHWLPVAFMVVGVALLLWFAWRDRGVPWSLDAEDHARPPAAGHDPIRRLRRVADRG